MATTQNGIYYQADYTKSADILADMKQMAESIDGIIEEEKETTEQTIQEIQETQTTQNQKIQELDDNQIHVTTEKSSNINIQDASGQNAKIKLFGISKQKTREGYNLANLDRETYTKNGVTVTNNGDGSFTLNGTSTSAGDLMLTQNEDISKSIYNFENANYLLKTFVKSGSFANSGDVAVQTVCMGQLNGQTSYNILNDRLYLNEFTDTDEIAENSFLARIELYIGGAGVTFNNYTIQILLAKSNDINLEYEQYGASPSPKHPSEIKNTGDNINLFNDGQIKSYADSFSSDYIDVKGLKEIILSGDDVVRSNGGAFYDAEKQYVSGFTTPQIWNGIQVPDNANYVRVTITTEKLDKIKLEKGKKSTSYSPYKYENVDITVCNKNLFNIDEFKDFFDLTETGTDAGHDYVAYTTKSYTNNKFMQGKFKANTQYTISFLGRQKQVGQGQTSGFVFNYTDGTSSIKYVNNDEIWTKYTLTSDKNKTIDYISMTWAYGGTIWLSDIQLEVNNVATEHIEHEQQLITFPLQENQKLYDGDYLADDGIHHKRKQIELDGTEDWLLSGLMTNNQYILNISDIKIIGENSKGNLISSHFKEILGVEGYRNNNINGISGWGTKQIRISLDINIVNRNVTEFKNFLSQQKQAGTPVKIEYPLAKETIEAYTEEQQTAYNQLQNAKTYKTITNVFTENAEVEMEYIADTKIYVDNQINQRLSNLENQVLELAGGN